MRGVRQSTFLFISHANVFPADICWASVLQIVKLQSKISMVIDSHHNTPREMTFESARVRRLDPQMESFSPFHAPHGIVSIFQKRDAFCHLLQLMKSRHSKQSEPDVISVFVGTWNMGKLLPPATCQQRHRCSPFLFHLCDSVWCLQVDHPLHVLCRPGLRAVVWATPLMRQPLCSHMTSMLLGLKKTLKGRRNGLNT